VEINLEQVAATLGSLTAATGAAALAWKKVLRPLVQYATRVSTIMDNLEKIKHQLMPNGGSSMRDAIDRIEARMIIAEQRQKLLTMDSPFAVFETDANGNCIHVNRTYCRWTGRTTEELEGKGWLNALHPDHRQLVFSEWTTAVTQLREFSMDYKLQAVDGARFDVHCSAFPMFDTKCGLAGWMGIISRGAE